jgi:hypothetical protein
MKELLSIFETERVHFELFKRRLFKYERHKVRAMFGLSGWLFSHCFQIQQWRKRARAQADMKLRLRERRRAEMAALLAEEQARAAADETRRRQVIATCQTNCLQNKDSLIM